MRKMRNVRTLAFLAALVCAPLSNPCAQAQRLEQIQMIEQMGQLRRGRHVHINHQPVRKPTSKAVVFQKAKFPIVLAPDKDSGMGAHIAFPVQHVEGNTFSADVKLLIEKEKADDTEEKTHHVSVYLQNRDTGHSSGFVASSRTVQVNKVHSSSLTHNFSNNNPTKIFYLSVFAPASCPPVKIVDVTLKGYRLIEKELPDEKEEAAITAMIGRLGADKFSDREAAQKDILETGQKTLPVLEQFKDDDDPERGERVRAIIQKLKAKDPLRNLVGDGSVR